MTLLKELVSVAKSLGSVSTHDLQALGMQLDVAKRDAFARVRIFLSVGFFYSFIFSFSSNFVRFFFFLFPSIF